MDQEAVVTWLNYHHLLYFWMVAREGSVSKASRQLRLAQPTVSGQLRLLAYGLHLGARLPVHATSTGRVLLTIRAMCAARLTLSSRSQLRTCSSAMPNAHMSMSGPGNFSSATPRTPS